LRRDIQATIGGLNCSLGLAYGMAQMVNLSAIGVKYLFKGLKFVLSKVFNINNVITPVKLALKLLFGTDFSASKTIRDKQKSLEYLEQLWAQTPQSA